MSWTLSNEKLWNLRKCCQVRQGLLAHVKCMAEDASTRSAVSRAPDPASKPNSSKPLTVCTLGEQSMPHKCFATIDAFCQRAHVVGPQALGQQKARDLAAQPAGHACSSVTCLAGHAQIWARSGHFHDSHMLPQHLGFLLEAHLGAPRGVKLFPRTHLLRTGLVCEGAYCRTKRRRLVNIFPGSWLHDRRTTSTWNTV